MANTTYLNIEIADVGGDNNAWGTITNAALNAFDSCLRPTGNGTSVGLNVGAGNTLTVAGAFAGGSATSFAMPATATAGGSVVVTLAGTQTLTNKTLTSPTINTGTLATPVFTGTPTGTVTSGTYTPTISNDSGFTSASVGSAFSYIRVGDVVTVSGGLLLDPTSTGTNALSITLPIASDFATIYDLAGNVCSRDFLNYGVAHASAASDNVTIVLNVTNAASDDYMVHFQYKVI